MTEGYRAFNALPGVVPENVRATPVFSTAALAWRTLAEDARRFGYDGATVATLLKRETGGVGTVVAAGRCWTVLFASGEDYA